MSYIAEAKDVLLHSTTGKAFIIALIILGTILLTRFLNRTIERGLKKSSKHINVDPTQYSLLRHTVSAFIYLVGFSVIIYTIPSLRSLAISLLAGAGIFAVIIGFASQQAFSNIVSGVMIAISRPFRVGDTIAIRDTLRGTVEDITLRHTVIKDMENKRIIVPNSIMGSEIIQNESLDDERIFKKIEFDISYESNIDKAMKIIAEVAQKHPKFMDYRTDEEKKRNVPVEVLISELGESGIRLRTRVWTKNPEDAMRLASDVRKSVKHRFDKAGIEIPYPHRTIVYKK